MVTPSGTASISGEKEKAKIISKEAGLQIECMLNPTELALSKTVNWSRQNTRESNTSREEFIGGNSAQMQLELFFDTYEEGGDVREKYISNLVKLTEIISVKGERRPPICVFQWGKIVFTAVITSLSLRYTLFLHDGTPVRAIASVTLSQSKDESQQPEQEAMSPSPTLGVPGQKIRVVRPGETIDLIAYEEYGSPKVWRRIADINNLDNPRDLQPGQVLVIAPFT